MVVTSTTRHTIIDLKDADATAAMRKMAELFIEFALAQGHKPNPSGEEAGSYAADDVMIDVIRGGKHYLLTCNSESKTFSLEEIRA